MMIVRCTPQLPLCAAAAFLAASLCGCSSKSPCQNPTGDGCGRTGAYTDDDPKSVCHVCCESNASSSDAWTEVSQTDIASAQFTAYVKQGHPLPGDASFSVIGATWNGTYFSFDGYSDFGVYYHLLTRGRSDEGNLHLFYFSPGDGPVSAAPLNCTMARN
ncbi:MAG TPA: hypothetical protein VFV14_03040 [Myxococcaceae bacterium]|nr:hypothetical protein [Myxococcaceae bacterium]